MVQDAVQKGISHRDQQRRIKLADKVVT